MFSLISILIFINGEIFIAEMLWIYGSGKALYVKYAKCLL